MTRDDSGSLGADHDGGPARKPPLAAAGAALSAPARRPGPAMRRARHYSRFVVMMKLLLPSVAVVMLGIVLAWPQIRERTEQLDLGLPDMDPRDANPRVLEGPRYHGLDEQDQPYTLIAETAEELEGHPDWVDLVEPVGDISLHSGRWVSLEGNTGLYSKIERTLDLSGDVMLYRDDGFEFHTEGAFIDLRTSSARGSRPVRGQGPGRTIRSEGFDMQDGGAVVTFTGKARLLMDDAGGGIAP
ncbi:LPS export ABC transporter periplasmic protein LptC [Roseospira navarrensis]|nr:LPS export ABC transporter periplasmic protein LptC [Roseospira navarrensis]